MRRRGRLLAVGDDPYPEEARHKRSQLRKRRQAEEDHNPQLRQGLCVGVPVLALGRRLEDQRHKAGLSVSELNAEMIVDVAIVRANWR